MSVDLTAVEPALIDNKHFNIPSWALIPIHVISRQPFYYEQPPVTSDESMMAARACWCALEDGGVEREYMSDEHVHHRANYRNYTLEDLREIVTEYAEFAEDSGGYTVWA